MFFKETVNIVFAMDANVVGGLFNLHTIEFGKEGIASKGDVGTNCSNEFLTDGNRRSSDGKIIDLAADIDLVSAKEAPI